MTKHRGDMEICRTVFGRNLGYSRTITTTSASTLTLNAFSTGYQIFEGAVSGQILNLGDATTYFKEGQSFFIINESDNTINIEDFGNNLLYELRANFSTLAVLEENGTAEGKWRFLLFIDNTLDFVATSASPGFSFGRANNVNAGTFLLRPGGPPSNQTGVTFGLYNGSLDVITVGTENLNTYSLNVWQHDGNFINPVLITSVNLVTTRAQTLVKGIDYTEINAPIRGKQFAVELATGSGRNPGVDLQLSGTTKP